MSSLYTLTQDIRFNKSVTTNPTSPGPGNVFNVVTQVGYFSFPSNVINCSITISQNTTNQASQSSGNSGISYLGAGVDNITSVGNQVHFTAWMQALTFNSNGDNFDLIKFLDPNISYLTLMAFAECE